MATTTKDIERLAAVIEDMNRTLTGLAETCAGRLRERGVSEEEIQALLAKVGKPADG